MSDIRPLNEKSLSDALSLVEKCFPSEASDILCKLLTNPCRGNGASTGYLGYENGCPVCLQAYIDRNYYIGKKQIGCRLGAMSCIAPGAPVEPFLDVKIAGYKESGGNIIRVSNSLNDRSARIAEKTRASRKVPSSCSRYIWRAIRPFSCLMYFVRRKVLKLSIPNRMPFDSSKSRGFVMVEGDFEIRRINDVAPDFFNVLMDHYVETNEGVVGSRRVADIDWAFGDWIRKGQIIILGAFEGNQPVGYLMMDGKGDGRRWMLCDLFAVNNELAIIDILLKAACNYLRKHTPAMMFETIGFATFVQPVLKKYLPHVREVGHSTTTWNVFERKDREVFEPVIDTSKSWFFGPYDGDVCL